MVSLNDDFDGRTEVCFFECPDSGPQLKLSENEEFDLKIVSIGDVVIRVVMLRFIYKIT